VQHLSVLWLENHAGAALCEWHAELEKLRDYGSEVLEEKIIILSICLDPLLEGLVRNESHVGREHHQGLGGLILVLLMELAG
jgi:hypothetical protein